MDETLVSDFLLPKYLLPKFTKFDQILRHLGMVKTPYREVLYELEVIHVAHM